MHTSPEHSSRHSDSNDEMLLKDLITILWQRKILCAFCIAMSVLLSALLVYSLPNIYYSEATLIPSASYANQAGGVAPSLGSLVKFAGVTASSNSKFSSAIEILKTRLFLIEFIARHSLEVPLAAAKRWDEDQESWEIDPELYDQANRKWMDNKGKSLKPSEIKLYNLFIDKLRITIDKDQQVLRIGLESKSPIAAKEWTERLIADLNKHLSERDITTAKQKIRFLNSQISKTSESRLQSVLYDMIAEQMEILVLAEQPINYAFTVIDPPIVPIERFKPNRTRYIAAGVLLGLVLALGASLAQYTYSRNKRRTSLHS